MAKGILRAADLQHKELSMQIGGLDQGFYINGEKVEAEVFYREEKRGNYIRVGTSSLIHYQK
ncbi:MAG: hypothetical protein ICV56_08315 [Nitrososphaeraceae archaeon]|nr:hypothetical protein [Nitrososphaeraceae archaeon]